MKLRLLFIVILLCIAGGASADDADRLIADFDRKADVGGIKGINGISAKGFGGIGYCPADHRVVKAGFAVV